MSDILSKEEISELLAALSVCDVREQRPREAAEPVEDKEGKIRRVRNWDFSRPERFSKDQTRTVRMVHQHFARLYAASLSELMRSVIEIDVAEVRQTTHSEFIRSLPESTCLALLRMAPLEREAIIEISPALSSAFIDRLAGGKGVSQQKERELTEIEQALLLRVVNVGLESLREAWENVVRISPSCEEILTSPQSLAQLYLPGETALLVSLGISMGDYAGSINIFIPRLLLEPVIENLSARSWFSTSAQPSAANVRRNLESQIQGVELPVTAVLDVSRVSAKKIASLEVGQVWPLDKTPEDEVLLLVKNVPAFRGKPLVVSGRRAVEITKRAKC